MLQWLALKRKLFIQVLLMSRILITKQKQMNLSLIVNFLKLPLKKQARQLLIETKKMKTWLDLLKKLVFSNSSKTK